MRNPILLDEVWKVKVSACRVGPPGKEISSILCPFLPAAGRGLAYVPTAGKPGLARHGPVYWSHFFDVFFRRRSAWACSGLIPTVSLAVGSVDLSEIASNSANSPSLLFRRPAFERMEFPASLTWATFLKILLIFRPAPGTDPFVRLQWKF